MGLSLESQAGILATIINNTDIRKELVFLHILPEGKEVTAQDIMDTLQKKPNINATEIIVILKIVCAVMGQVCPIINGL